MSDMTALLPLAADQAPAPLLTVSGLEVRFGAVRALDVKSTVVAVVTCTSGLVRYSMGLRSKRLLGIASTRWARATQDGSVKATKRKKE